MAARKKAAAKKESARKSADKKPSVKKSAVKKSLAEDPETKKKSAARKAAVKKVAKKVMSRVLKAGSRLDGAIQKLRSELDRKWATVTRQRETVHEVFTKFHDEILSHPDVCGLHVGLKRKDGKIVYPLQYCITVHVPKKWPLGHPMLQNAIDLKRFKHLGVQLDVIERSYRLLSTGSGAAAAARGPFVGGMPIASSDFPDHFGTMGMVVFFGGQPHYLTNEHVAGKPGSTIIESNQGVTASGLTGVLGTVVNSLRNSSVDCAIIAPSGSRKRGLGIIGPGGVLPGVYVTRKLTSVDEHKTQVFKIGAKTGFSPILVGTVQNVNTTIQIGGLTMTGQILVDSQSDEPIIAPGDSGSLAIVQSVQNGTTINAVVGLIHAETVEGSVSGHAMVANHFDLVESAMRISLFPA